MSRTIPSLGINYAMPAQDRAALQVWRDRQLPASTGSALTRNEPARQRLAADLEAFLAAGGQIERLPTSPVGEGFQDRELERYRAQRAKGRLRQALDRMALDEDE